MLGKTGITISSKVLNLIQSLHAKEGYKLSYLTLQLYVLLGVKRTNIRRVLKFRQAKWMASFLDLNSQLGKAAKTEFDETFYKLILNFFFGKTMESKRNRKKLALFVPEKIECKNVVSAHSNVFK